MAYGHAGAAPAENLQHALAAGPFGRKRGAGGKGDKVPNVGGAGEPEGRRQEGPRKQDAGSDEKIRLETEDRFSKEISSLEYMKQRTMESNPVGLP